MGDTYFTKFPVIEYNNQTVRDISRNVRMKNDITKNASLFYPYELTDGLRADLLAYSYYDDPYYDWLIYLTNGIIDPYYGWYLSQNEFQDFIAKKYGSFENAVNIIHHWQLSWADFDDEISVSFFNNNLPTALKKYYTPKFGYAGQILTYARKPAPWVANTNRILTVMGINGSGPGGRETDSLVPGDIVTFTAGGGRATVVFATDTTAMVHHVSGTCSAPGYIHTSDNVKFMGITSVNVTAVNISLDEEVFWQPVTAYDWENQRNEAKKHLYLLDANFSLEVSEDLRKKLQE